MSPIPIDERNWCAAFDTLIESSRLDSGCLDCRLYADVADPNALTLVEEWATRPDMERRLRSAAYGQLLQLMEVSREPPGNGISHDHGDIRPGDDSTGPAPGFDGTTTEWRVPSEVQRPWIDHDWIDRSLCSSSLHQVQRSNSIHL